ncbi:MAG: substrate-binding protein [Rhodospirillales bacterium]|nr:substrate-binding protein [Rhodospirillales bacterium]MCW8862547.1 substrate-binding protein [Rhodospirillales bacterium]MCW8969836.1 substrate-binding protein [Rhodospirillales bacterium]MCW9001154.1 substrate-binding protein [Rhodospirillales bacterium]
MTDFNNKFTRRGVLKGGSALAGAAFVTPTFFFKDAFAADFLNNPGNAKSIKLGFNVPQTGPYSEEGADELRAYKLAVKHLNGEGDGGMLNTMKPLALKGNGVLGKKVEYLTGDTQTKSDAARASAKNMIDKGALMITGGSSSGVAVAVQSLCNESKIIFMAGLTHSNDTTGKDKKRYGFRHFFNAYMSGQALAPVLEKEFGKDRRAYHLTADYTWGWTQEESIKNATEKLGWSTVAPVRTPLKQTDFSSYITQAINSDADVLVLNHYGKNMVDSLSSAVQFDLRNKMAKTGKQWEIVVPLFSRLMAQGAGDNIKGILGSTNWNWKLTDAGSQAFVKSFGAEYGQPPSMAAQTCYVQTLLYADACERAGTFAPAGVIPALEGFKFDGMGNGPTEYRAADHQCFKDVLVVRGNPNPTSQFDLLNVEQIVPRSQVEYPAEMFGGELGPI